MCTKTIGFTAFSQRRWIIILMHARATSFHVCIFICMASLQLQLRNTVLVTSRSASSIEGFNTHEFHSKDLTSFRVTARVLPYTFYRAILYVARIIPRFISVCFRLAGSTLSIGICNSLIVRWLTPYYVSRKVEHKVRGYFAMLLKALLLRTTEKIALCLHAMLHELSRNKGYNLFS